MVLTTRLLLGVSLWRNVAAQTKAPPPNLDLEAAKDDADLTELGDRNNNGTLSWYFGEERASKHASEADTPVYVEKLRIWIGEARSSIGRDKRLSRWNDGLQSTNQ
jgi:hypothetical protein